MLNITLSPSLNWKSGRDRRRRLRICWGTWESSGAQLPGADAGYAARKPLTGFTVVCRLAGRLMGGEKRRTLLPLGAITTVPEPSPPSTCRESRRKGVPALEVRTI